ncbi:MAG: tyrosine-type recombinase/integrase [Thermoguttaceae bacterium]
MKTKYNTRFRLTPMPPTKRWRKVYKGKTYYLGVGHCSGKTDRTGYAIALDEWKALKTKLDGTPTEVETSRYDAIQTNREQWRLNLPPATLEEFKTDLADNDRVIEKVEGKKNGKGTIGQSIADFTKIKMSRYALGDLSAMRVQTIGQHLRHFEKFAGKDTPITAINEEMVLRYRECLLTDIQANAYGKTTAHDRWNTFKEFVKSLYQVPLPRNLNSRDLAIKKPTKEVSTFTDDEIKTLLGTTPEIFNLYILLMLNCGMLAGDIGDLKPSEVNWETGVITRKRSKEKNQLNAPIVAYKLWDKTFTLLKKYGKQEGERVFTNRKGNPLVERIFKSSGKMKSYDSIYESYCWLVPDKSRKPLMAIRKTGASKLAQHPQYKWYADYYLGHSPKGIAEKHYIKPEDTEFFEALKWLGEQFAVL